MQTGSRKIRHYAGVALAVLLVSCGPVAGTPAGDGNQADANASPAEPGSNARPANKWSQKLFDMDGPARRTALKGIVESSGSQCDAVTSAMLKGHEDKMDMWHVTCGNGDWMVSIDEDASTKTLSCETLAKVGSDCNKVWKN